MIAFVSGGARSGKSARAETLARAWQAEVGGGLYYLATAMDSDTEMARRIARHRQERGENWTTLEAPVDLRAAMAKVESGGIVLLDCLTLWASQVLYSSPLSEAEAREMLQAIITEVRARKHRLVVVSNDVNEDMPSPDAEVQRYLAFLQGLHRQVAGEADVVMQVIAGLPVYWKGGPP